MEVELIALAAANATLTKTQFTRIEANLLSSSAMKSGALTVTIEVKLQQGKNGSPNVLSTVLIEVVGTPKDSKKGDPPVFTIKVGIHGVYTWDTAPDPLVFVGKRLSSLLAKPLHVLAVSEVHSLANKLGLTGVNLKWEVPGAPASTPRKKLSASKKANITTVVPKATPLLKKSALSK